VVPTLGILGHEAVVHILVRVLLALVLPEAVDEIFEAETDLIPVPQEDVHQRRWIYGEKEDVDDQVPRRQIGGGVSLVLGGVEDAAAIDGPGHVVQGSGVVVDPVRVDGQVRRIVCVGEPHAEDDKHAGEHTHELVQGGEERNHQRVRVVEQERVPIPGRPRIQTQSVVESRQGRKLDVVRRDPGYPTELAEGCEDVLRKPEVDKHGGECDHEELEPSHSKDRPERTFNLYILLGMEGGVQSNGHQGGRPYAVRRVDEETPRQSS